MGTAARQSCAGTPGGRGMHRTRTGSARACAQIKGDSRRGAGGRRGARSPLATVGRRAETHGGRHVEAAARQPCAGRACRRAVTRMAAAVAALHGQSVGACVGGLAGAGGLASAFQRPRSTGAAGQARVACTKKRMCTHAAGCGRVPPSKCRGTRLVAPPCTCAKLRGARMGAAARRTRLGCVLSTRKAVWGSGKH